MGTLKPGAKYVYERVDNVVYAREEGTDASTRVAIGWEASDSRPRSTTLDQMLEDKLWGEIRRAAKTHPGLAEELERVKMFYYLLKQDKQNNIMWHPV